jgi:hypothetical protein
MCGRGDAKLYDIGLLCKVCLYADPEIQPDEDTYSAREEYEFSH